MAEQQIERGQRFYAPDFRTFLTVSRVARDGSWADVLVSESSTGETWTKRQPLRPAGAFPFEVREVTRG